MILARWIEHSSRARPACTPHRSEKAGRVPFPRRLTSEQVQPLSESPIPLPSSRNPLPSGVLGKVIQDVLKLFQLEWPDLRVKHLKDVFFSKGSRPCCLLFPEKLELQTIDDHLHPGRRAVRLSFELSKGSYATIMVKRITAAADGSR